MTLKGNFSALTTYNVGDVVCHNGEVFHLQKPADAGTYPTNTLYWGKLNQTMSECVKLIMDLSDTVYEYVGGVQEQLQEEIDSYFADDKTLVLGSSTASSTKKFAITVDDDGDLAAAEITEEGEG